MERKLMIALAGAAFAASTPAISATTVLTPAPVVDPCTYTFVTNAIACQGYYGGNLITGTKGSATTAEESYYIKLLLTGTPLTTDALPTNNGPTYTGSYPGLNYGTVLGAIEGLNGSATLNFGALNLSGLTVLGAHFGNNTDSDVNTVTAFWLLDLGSTATHTITLSNGKGSSNAQIFATGTPAVPEPATWAMMLFGFGGIGMAMRRGKRRTGALRQIA